MNLLKSIIEEDLRKWFGSGKKGGWDRYNTKGEKIGKCGDGEPGDAYAACLSNEKSAKLGPKGRASFVKRKRVAQKKAGDAKKGGEQSKGQKPTLVKTKANEMKINLVEKQLKGLEGIPSNVSLEKISKADKLRIIKQPGNIIDFFVPDWAKSRYKFWQVIGTGKIKKNMSGKFYLAGRGPNKSSPTFETMDDLIDGVDWKSVEQTRRFNEEKSFFSKLDTGDKIVGKFPPFTEFVVIGTDGKKMATVKNIKTGKTSDIYSTNNFKIKESVNEQKVYIDYLNKKKGFKQDRIKFNSYDDAVKWAKKNFDKFSPDMIKYESVNEKDYASKIKENVKPQLQVEQKMELFLEKNVPNDPEKWSYAKSQAKKKFDVYPSAYANGWAAKKYKELGGGWKKEK